MILISFPPYFPRNCSFRMNRFEQNCSFRMNDLRIFHARRCRRCDQFVCRSLQSCLDIWSLATAHLSRYDGTSFALRPHIFQMHVRDIATARRRHCHRTYKTSPMHVGDIARARTCDIHCAQQKKRENMHSLASPPPKISRNRSFPIPKIDKNL